MENLWLCQAFSFPFQVVSAGCASLFKHYWSQAWNHSLQKHQTARKQVLKATVLYLPSPFLLSFFPSVRAGSFLQRLRGFLELVFGILPFRSQSFAWLHDAQRGTRFAQYHSFEVWGSLVLLGNRLPMSNKPHCAVLDGKCFTATSSYDNKVEVTPCKVTSSCAHLPTLPYKESFAENWIKLFWAYLLYS